MPAILKLKDPRAELIRRGQDYVWSVILDLTKETDTFRFRDVMGVCRIEEKPQLLALLGKFCRNGVIEKLPRTDHSAGSPYRLLQRQADCPVLTADGRASTSGRANQQMWNVMRRARSGFTVNSLALDASTDDVVIAVNTAKQYCMLLTRAGILKVLQPGTRGEGRNIYVLTGSGNTGPKPPKKLSATMVFDQNSSTVVGDVIVEDAP